RRLSMTRSTSPIIRFPRKPPVERGANDQDRDSRPQPYRRRHGGRDSGSAYPKTIKPFSIIIEAKNEGTQPFNPRLSRTSLRNFRRRKVREGNTNRSQNATGKAAPGNQEQRVNAQDTSAEPKPDLPLEIAHVLLIDVVGYS